MGNPALIEELERQFGDNPQRVFARLASEYRKAGDLARAIELCRTYVPQQPGYISGHIVLGQALYESGELDEAQQTFETALQLDPENLIALRQLGDIALARGDIAGARSWYTRLLDVDPQNEEVVAQLAALDNPPPAASVVPPPTGMTATGAAASEPARTSADPTLDRIAAQLEGALPPGVGVPHSPAHGADADVAPVRATPSDAELSAWWESEGDAQAPEPAAPAAGGEEPTRPQPSLGLEAFAAMFDQTTIRDNVAEHEPLDAAVEGLTSAEESPFIDLGAPAAGADAARDPGRPFSPVADFSLPPLEIASTELDLGTPKPPSGKGRSPEERAGDEPAERTPWSPLDSAPTDASTETAYPWKAKSSPAEGEGAGVTESPFAAAGVDSHAPPSEEKPWSPFADDEADHAAASVAPEVARRPDIPDAFVTETMAELYVQQGLLRQAVEVYRRLTTMRPEEDTLRVRLSELEDELALANSATDRGTPEPDLSLTETDADAEATGGAPADADEAAEESAPLVSSASGGDATASIAAQRAEAASREPAMERRAEDRREPAPARAQQPATRGRTVRAFFSALGARRSERGTPPQAAAAASAPAATRPHDEAGDGRVAPQTTHASDAPSPSGGDRSGEQAQSSPTDSASPKPDLPGEPSRAAPSALSLDEVFRETLGRPPRPDAPAESLDEFYSESEEADGEGGAARGGAPPPSAAADLEAFNAWLEGLKK